MLRAAAGGAGTIAIFGLGTVFVTNIVLSLVKGAIMLRQVRLADSSFYHMLWRKTDVAGLKGIAVLISFISLLCYSWC